MGARIPRQVLERAIAHSLCFGLYREAEQIGFARVVTDAASFAYLADVFVVAESATPGSGSFSSRRSSRTRRCRDCAAGCW